MINNKITIKITKKYKFTYYNWKKISSSVSSSLWQIFLWLCRKETLFIFLIIIVQSLVELIPGPHKRFAYILDFVFHDVFPLVIVSSSALHSRTNSAGFRRVWQFALAHVRNIFLWSWLENWLLETDFIVFLSVPSDSLLNSLTFYEVFHHVFLVQWRRYWLDSVA